jgi:hypothetical protein
VSILGGGGGFIQIFEKSPPIFSEAGTILHRERREKINKCNKFLLYDMIKISCFSNPLINTVQVKIYRLPS